MRRITLFIGISLAGMPLPRLMHRAMLAWIIALRVRACANAASAERCRESWML
jgi:hypothetical protein